ncbi:MAG: hypothetical protein RL701_7984 [Pseudomonadota bacterium]
MIQVLLLTPTRATAPELWAGIARGLRNAGLRAVQVADLAIDPVFAACSQPECAKRAAEAAQMPALLCARESRDDTLAVQWFERDGKALRAGITLANQSVTTTATEIATHLRRQRALGGRALLRVDSRPTGATLTIDGELAGLTPYERELNPGEHKLRVELDGRPAATRSALLQAGSVERVSVSLTRPVGPQPHQHGAAHPPLNDRAAPLNNVFGAVLGIAALPLLIAATNSLIDDKQCLASDARGCVERARFGAGDGVLLGTGIVALAGAGLFLFDQPLRIALDPRERAVSVRVGGAF